MPVKISIKNLKHIDTLDFIVPERGVWLLTGPNGTGKTSLLACMRRIGERNAFPMHFKVSTQSSSLDSVAGASVEYDINGVKVKYKYSGTRWTPLPRANANALKGAGYPGVLYIAADARRIEPRPEDFKPRGVRAAHASIIAGANSIFDTQRFSHLKTINLSRGVGNDAFLLELPARPGQTGKSYASEKNFSLGELCIIKLLRMLKDCPAGSLVLIDELELALHPMAQVALLRHLDDVAESKQLTIVVSTHSATLIKQAGKQRLLLLENDGKGNITCLDKCFPSMVLGALAYGEENAADRIIYVEDDAAKVIVDHLVGKVCHALYKGLTPHPSVQSVPVGGFVNVLRFFKHQKALVPAITRCFVLLDADAEPSLANAVQPDVIAIRDTERASISYLTVTPEVGLAQYLDQNTTEVRNALRAHYNLPGLQFVKADLGVLPPALPRKPNKKYVWEACEKLAKRLPNGDASKVEEVLLKLLANHLYATDRATIMRRMSPLLS
ncbi:ATP-dependent endonuclease [Achromobacter sp. Root83]|uniref:ATP-dependent nuclease n=1 Tax=Achromobacter sp. Root83 TaxID=1736602 RepID=UPI0009E866A3|nr:AAA family ATPase [Achromobacter sp. Root83]